MTTGEAFPASFLGHRWRIWSTPMGSIGLSMRKTMLSNLK